MKLRKPDPLVVVLLVLAVVAVAAKAASDRLGAFPGPIASGTESGCVRTLDVRTQP